jgi:hypothetical protein
MLTAVVVFLSNNRLDLLRSPDACPSLSRERRPYATTHSRSGRSSSDRVGGSRRIPSLLRALRGLTNTPSMSSTTATVSGVRSERPRDYAPPVQARLAPQLSSIRPNELWAVADMPHARRRSTPHTMADPFGEGQALFADHSIRDEQ